MIIRRFNERVLNAKRRKVMRKKSVVCVASAICIAAAACGCASEEEDIFTGEMPELPAWQANLDAVNPSVYTNIDDLDLEPGTYISVIGKAENTPYWQQVKAGVEQAAADINERLGYSGADEVKVLYNAPAEGEDVDEQVNILDEEMSRYPDVIAIASIDENASSVQFDLAVENGIQIVAFDSGNSYQGIQCTCMTDNAAAAEEGASRLCEAIGDSGEVALFVHDSVSGNARERADAFTEEIRTEHPDVTVAETIYLDQMDQLKRQAAAEELGVSAEQLEQWSEAASGLGTEAENTDNAAEKESGESGEISISEEARTRLEDIDAIAAGMSNEETAAYYLGKHPDLKGCFGVNDETVRLAAQAVKSLELTDAVTVMGFDAGKEQIDALEDGSIDGLVVQNPFGMGYATVVASARTVLEIGNEAVVDTGYTWVDASGLENESIRAMLYE